MNIEKRISPFLDNIIFEDKVTLLKTFQQKALLEGWTKEEINQVIIKAADVDLSSAIKVIEAYIKFPVEIDNSDNSDNSDDNWSPYDSEELDEEIFLK